MVSASLTSTINNQNLARQRRSVTITVYTFRDFNNSAVDKLLIKVNLNNWTDLEEKQFGIKNPCFKCEC